MITEQLTKNAPVFYVFEVPSKADPTKLEYQVKRGFYVRSVETDTTTAYVLSPFAGGAIRPSKQIESKYVFSTEEEATACAEALTAAAENN